MNEDKNYDFIVGFTIFMKSGYKTMHRHFSSLERAQRFANNVNIKDNHKIYVDYDLYQKEKEKNKALEYIENKLMPLAECGYWNYKNHTCTHTCRGCDSLHENNRRTDTGILIDKDRYCRLYEDGDFEEDTKMVSVNDLIARHWKGSNNGK